MGAVSGNNVLEIRAVLHVMRYVYSSHSSHIAGDRLPVIGYVTCN